MLLISLRFQALMLAALTAGMSFAHVLERPARMRCDASLYGTLRKTLPDKAFLAATPGNMPSDWMELRARWEDGHAMRFAFHLCALGLLILSVLIEMEA